MITHFTVQDQDQSRRIFTNNKLVFQCRILNDLIDGSTRNLSNISLVTDLLQKFKRFFFLKNDYLKSFAKLVSHTSFLIDLFLLNSRLVNASKCNEACIRSENKGGTN